MSVIDILEISIILYLETLPLLEIPRRQNVFYFEYMPFKDEAANFFVLMKQINTQMMFVWEHHDIGER